VWEAEGSFMTELKPCPFCGSPAETDSNRGYRAIGNGKLGRGVAVYCTECNADMMYCCEDLVGCTPEEILDDLIQNWNRRPATPATPVPDPALTVGELAEGD
jgi:hypothetical protein